MLRKLAIAIAASGAMISTSQIHALGMGEIELESALNQPLDARIKLLKASELENWEIKPNLASVEEFDKTGVDRVFFLNNIKFEVERIGPDVFVNISSDQAVVEPFLNFLVRVDWPNGRLLREYTLLLDPPVFTEEAPAPVKAPETQYDVPEENLPGMAPAPVAPSAYQKPVTKEQPKPKAPVAKVKPKKSETYKVRANDTLWEVAIRTRENRRITPQQAMLAIQDLNPDAFINGNINRLKKNQVLRVPSKEQMLSRSFNESVAEVALQNQAVAQRKAKKAQLDATRKEFVNEREDKLDDSRLKLLAGGDATTDMERGASGQVAAETAGNQARLDKELSLAFENLDKSQRENQELRTRLDALEDQINTLQRLINLKDEQMVALQSGVAQRDELKVNKAADVAVIAEPETEAAKDLLQLAMKADGAEDLNFAAGDVTKKAPKSEDTVKNKSVPAPQPMDEPFDPVAFVIENPPVMGGILGALLAGLLGVNYFRKRKEQQLAESQQGDVLDADDPLAQADLDLDADLDNEFSDLDMGESEESDFPELGSSDSNGDLAGNFSEESDLQSADVLGEAEGYLAYGRLEPARDLLLKALESQPSRMDVRIKLAEVASQLSDDALSAEQIAYIEENGSEDDKASVAQLQSGEFDAGLSEDGFEGLDLGDSGDLETDSFDLDLETGDLDVSADLESLDGDDLDMDSSDLDFDLEGLELNEPEAANELAADDSGLEFDLDLGEADDLDLGLNETSESDLLVPELEADDLSLDFELDEESELSLDGLDVGDDDSNIADLTLDEDDEFSLDFEATDTNEAEEGFEFESTEDLSNSLDFELPDSDGDLELGSDDLSLELAGDELESLDEELSLDSLDDLGDLSDLDEALELDSGDDTSLDFAELEASLNEGGEDLDLEAGEFELDLPESDLVEESIDLDMESLDLGSEFDELPELDADDAVVLEVDDELPTLDDMQELNDLELAADEELSSLDADLASLDDDLSDLSIADNHDEVVEISLSEADELPTLEEFEVSDSDGSEVGALGGDLPELSSEDADLDLDTDLDFLSGTDESETKLDLARAYIDMDDKDGAREILQEVLDEGSDGQKQEANQLLDGLA